MEAPMTRMLALATALFLSVPAMSELRPSTLLDHTHAELAAMREDIRTVPSRQAQRQLHARVDRVESLLVRLENTGALHRGEHARARGPQRPPPAPPAPPGLSFDEAMHMVSVETFDRGKLEAVHRAARNGTFTTDEARLLAAQLTFDGGKADALIALYPAVIDPHRFGLALDILTFSSNRTKVAQTLGL